MKKMKKNLITAALTLLTVTLMAQGGKYGKTPQDSIKCVEGLSLYKDFVGKDNLTALSYWRIPYSVCPQSSEKMYLDGITIYSDFASKEKNATTKQKFIDTLLQVYDNRIANFGKEGFVRGRKGVDLFRFRPEQPEAAFAELSKSIELQNTKSEAAVIATYMQISAELEKTGKRTKEQVVEDYGLVSEIADYNVANNEKSKDFYSKAQENIDAIAAPYLSCEVLGKSLTDKYDANKENLNWLKKSESLLSRKGCTENQPYFNIAESLYKLEPSAAAAASMAKMYVGQKQYNKANDFFKQAVEQETDNSKKAEYTLYLAKVALINGQLETAKNYAQKAAGLRSGWGEPYMIIGSAYASGAGSCAQNECEKGLIFVAAVEQFAKAKAVDGSVAADANREIAKYSKYYPSNKDCFFHGIQDGSSYKIGCWINETVTVKTQ
jgi:tetratricopeptide (TPR) repeat protein